MNNEFKLKQLLRDRGYSTTRPRLLVFDRLQKSKGPVSVAELASQLKEIDNASTYRTIGLFESAGIIQRVWTGFKSKVELSEKFSSHHHHFTCHSCGKVISFDSKGLEDSLAKLEKTEGFKLTHHSVELSGFCESCSKN